MTDEQMDARLRNAGEAWRAATAPTVTEVGVGEPHALTPPIAPRPRRNHTGLLASAAAVAAALVAGGVVLIANISGGNNGNSADTAPLDGTVWQFVGYGDRLDSHSLSTLHISPDGQLIADDECEVLSAHVDSAGSSLNISKIAERFKDCTDTYEPAFSRGVDLLRSTPTYAITADGLTIGTGADAMHFVPSADLPAPTLDVPTFTDTDWRLVSATDVNGNVTTVDRELVFRVEDGRFTADEGCNKLSGEVTYRGSQADLKTVESTALPCPSPQPYEVVMEAVFQPGTVDTEVRGAAITISRSGGGSLTYQWVPANTAATDPSALIGHDWQLASIAGTPATGKVGLYASKTELSVTFGCGAVGGNAEIGHGSLHVAGIHDGAAPGCTGDVGDESTTVDSLLANDPLWRVDDGKLIISDASGAQGFALVFDSPGAPPPADMQLVGTNWTLAEIKDAADANVQLAGSATLSIDAEGRVKGNDGCNAMSGDVQLVDQTIDFGNGLAITEMACVNGDVMTTAQHVDAMLSGSVKWSIDGDRLTLTKDGVGTLVYQAGDASPSTKSTDPSDLIGVPWTLTTIMTGTGPDGAAASATPRTLLIDPGSSANLHDEICADPRNASVTSGSIDIEPANCPIVTPTSAAESQRVLDVLSGEVSWFIEGGQLTITKNGVGALVFNRTSPPTRSPLEGKYWSFVGVDTTAQPGWPSSDRPVTLSFVDSTYRLETGCGTYAGQAVLHKVTIDFSNQKSLGGDSCLNPLGEQLARFLDGTLDWTVDKGQLKLTNAATTLVFDP